MVKNILKVKKLLSGIELPDYALPTDVGLDLRAAEAVSLAPYEQKAVKTGIALEIPEGHVGLIRDRAGIITKMGIHTAAGTFDPAYRGEISVVLINFGEESVSVEPGMRIAQIIIIPVTKVRIQEVRELSETERHDKGFGSTGMKEIIRFEKSIKKSKKKK